MTVVKAYARTVVAPAIDYWRTTIDTKNGAEVARLKVARIFNPLHVMVYQISVADRHRQLEDFETDRASADHAAHRRHEVRDHQVPSSGEVYQASGPEKGRQGQRHFCVV